MEDRLYELIRDYQRDRVRTLGGENAEFRVNALRRFALQRPELYPEYAADESRITRAIEAARDAGEIVPERSGHRDEWLLLRIDSDRST